MKKKMIIISLCGGVLLSGCQSNPGNSRSYADNPKCSTITQGLQQFRQTSTTGVPSKKTAITQAKLLQEYQNYNCGPELNGKPTLFNATTYP